MHFYHIYQIISYKYFSIFNQNQKLFCLISLILSNIMMLSFSYLQVFNQKNYKARLKAFFLIQIYLNSSNLIFFSFNYIFNIFKNLLICIISNVKNFSLAKNSKKYLITISFAIFL